VKVLLAEKAGTCYGVQRSLDLAEEAFKKGKKVLMYGALIHNPQVIDALKAKGAEVIDSVKGVKNALVLIRAHGVPPKIIEELKANKNQVIDATCPFVSMVQNKAKALEDEGYQVVIVGEKDHAEVIGIKGSTAKGIVVEKPEEIQNIRAQLTAGKTVEEKQVSDLFLPRLGRIGIVSQTTQSDENFSSCVKELVKMAMEVKAFNTICNATHLRQKSAVELAKKVDLMIVVGGKESGNTKRLKELCEKIVETKHIETVSELSQKMFKGKKVIGVTAGASTPSFLIKEVIDFIEKQ